MPPIPYFQDVVAFDMLAAVIYNALSPLAPLDSLCFCLWRKVPLVASFFSAAL
jgi:hypothetical protein